MRLCENYLKIVCRGYGCCLFSSKYYNRLCFFFGLLAFKLYCLFLGLDKDSFNETLWELFENCLQRMAVVFLFVQIFELFMFLFWFSCRFISQKCVGIT